MKTAGNAAGAWRPHFWRLTETETAPYVRHNDRERTVMPSLMMGAPQAHQGDDTCA